jgi:DNA-binding protein H-NS
MKTIILESLTLDQLWDLHEQLALLLATRMTAEKRELEAKLSTLQNREFTPVLSDRTRRAYPRVHPKFRNPADPLQTWAGRGRTPGWVSKHLASGKSIDELIIAAAL